MLALLHSKRYTPNQFARESGVHVATVWRWMLYGVRGKKLKSRLLGGRRVILEEDAQAFLAQDDEPASDADLQRRAADAGKLLDARGVPRCAPLPQNKT
jgi:hypothetical protein